MLYVLWNRIKLAVQTITAHMQNSHRTQWIATAVLLRYDSRGTGLANRRLKKKMICLGIGTVEIDAEEFKQIVDVLWNETVR